MDKSALALLLLAAVGVSSAPNEYSERVQIDCTPSVDYTESINAYLRKIPNNFTVPPIKDKQMMGFKLSPPVVSGMGSMWTYRPYSTFCVDKQTFIETVVFADDPLTISMNWKSCTGSRGKLGTKVSASRLRLYFMAAPTAEEPKRIVLYNLGPDSLDDPHVFLEGAPGGLRELVDVMSIVAMPHIELLWRRFLRVDAPHILTTELGL